MENQTPLRIHMQGICKRFGGLQALDNVRLELLPGEIHALVGENGAGKSTLIKILSGAYQKDSGSVEIDGVPMEIATPKEGIEAGISTIYQELELIGDLTVAENIFLDDLQGGTRTINWRELRQGARELLDSLGFYEIDEGATVRHLRVAHQQIVEIAKALSKNSKVLILDEPTALLANREVEKLFALLRKLAYEKNVSILYVSHRLEEIFELCQRVTVFKDGRYVDTVNVSDIDDKMLVSLMVGRNMDGYFPKREANIGDIVFEVKNINCGKLVRNVSFHVRAGEVLGLSGLVGAGRTETARAIIGADRKESGEILLRGQSIKIRSPKDAFRHRIGYLSEDRKGQGVLINLPIRYNTTMSCLSGYVNGLNIIDVKKESADVTDLTKKLNLKAASINAKVNSLSGGNQQKVAISKLLASKCDILIFDEPTRGVDVGAKREIYALINQLAEEGNAIIMISSETPEIMGMCDRVIVMRDGAMTATLCGEDVNEQNFINAAMGVSV